MSASLTIRIDRPIVSAEILDGFLDAGGQSSDRGPADSGVKTRPPAAPDSLSQKTAFSQACQVLSQVVAKLQESCADVVARHREEIARLSVEIARKILMQKVEKGDYEIESIIKESLLHAPSRQDVVVRLNPEDLAQCLKAQQQGEPGGVLTGVQLVADPSIGRAECILESPKGIIKSLIDENLERVGKALGKAD
jgi:flagellar biosynthesis/type III secretory pathway protein FliH